MIDSYRQAYRVIEQRCQELEEALLRLAEAARPHLADDIPASASELREAVAEAFKLLGEEE
jgi:hypothetical protein